MLTFALLNYSINFWLMQDSSVAIRLKFFIDSKEISITQFADMCGIPRPTLSQLLSGRNKKLSDVIVKLIHNRFPELSVLWLMFGEGEMILPAPINPILVSEAEKFMDDTPVDSKESNLRDLKSAGSSVKTSGNEKLTTKVADVNIAGKLDNSRSASRKVVSITVFYDDNSYETFFPGKK